MATFSRILVLNRSRRAHSGLGKLASAVVAFVVFTNGVGLANFAYAQSQNQFQNQFQSQTAERDSQEQQRREQQRRDQQRGQRQEQRQEQRQQQAAEREMNRKAERQSAREVPRTPLGAPGANSATPPGGVQDGRRLTREERLDLRRQVQDAARGR
jgi:cytoskeletal protein RodZ